MKIMRSLFFGKEKLVFMARSVLNRLPLVNFTLFRQLSILNINKNKLQTNFSDVHIDEENFVINREPMQAVFQNDKKFLKISKQSNPMLFIFSNQTRARNRSLSCNRNFSTNSDLCDYFVKDNCVLSLMRYEPSEFQKERIKNNKEIAIILEQTNEFKIFFKKANSVELLEKSVDKNSELFITLSHYSPMFNGNILNVDNNDLKKLVYAWSEANGGHSNKHGGYQKAAPYACKFLLWLSGSVVSGYVTYKLLKPLVEKDEKKKEDEKRTKYSNMHMNNIEIKIKTPEAHVERGNVLEALRKKVKDASTNNPDDIVIVLVAGDSGTGKSVLAIDYAKDCRKKRHSEELATEWVIGAESEPEIRKNFLSFAKNELQINTNGKTLNTVIAMVNAELKKRPAWILIFDNVNNYESIEQYLPKESPQTGVGQILITSKTANMSNFPKKCVKIDLNTEDNKISPIQARNLFLALAGSKYESSPAHIDDVLEKLKGSITAIRTFALFVSSKLTDKRFDFEQECQKFTSALAANTDQSVDKVLYKQIFPFVSKEASMLLSVSKFFHPDRISKKMLSHTFEQIKGQDHTNFLAVYNELINFGLIEEIEDEKGSIILKIHRSLNEYLFESHDKQKIIKTSENLLKIAKELHGSDVFDANNEEKNGLFYLHFSGIFKYFDSASLSPIVTVEIATMVGSSYEYIGSWDSLSIYAWIKDLEKTIHYIEMLKSQPNVQDDVPKLNRLLVDNHKCLAKAYFFYLKEGFDDAIGQLNLAIKRLDEARKIGGPKPKDDILEQTLARNLVSARLERVIAGKSTQIEADLDNVISEYKKLLKYKGNDNEINTIICKDRLARAYIEKAKKESSSPNKKKYLAHAFYHVAGVNKEFFDQNDIEQHDKDVADDSCILAIHERLPNNKQYIREDENYVTLAMIYLEYEKFDDARECLNKAIQKNKRKRDIIEGDIHYYMAMLNYKQCKYTSCDKEIRECIDIFKNLYAHDSVHLKNGQELQRKNDYFIHIVPEKLITRFKNS